MVVSRTAYEDGRECSHLMLSGTEEGSIDWEPTMAANTGRMAMEERMVYGFEIGLKMGMGDCISTLANSET